MSQTFDTFLQVRLTTHDKERIKARALEAGMQTSEYVRKRALATEGWNDPPSLLERLAHEGQKREAQASVALDGETMYEGHPAVKRAERIQEERNARGAVVEQCETVEEIAAENMGSVDCPVETRPACPHCGYALGTEEHRLHCGEDAPREEWREKMNARRRTEA